MMVQIPIRLALGGKHALMNAGEDTARTRSELEDRLRRLEAIVRRRAYAEGTQFDKENEAELELCPPSPTGVQRLPEHRRLHAYSSQIEESVAFLADQLADGFRVEAKDARVQSVIDTMVKATPVLRGDSEGEEIVIDDLLREAMIPGDVAYELKWDPIEQTVYPEFWESEYVEFQTPDTETVEKVTRFETIWVKDAEGQDVEVEERVEYALHPNEAGVLECRKDVYWDQDESPRESEWLSLPLIPWGLLRADKRGLRTFRGDSVIRRRAMDAADRYDAVEQQSYLIARYNSHANLVVTGDGAAIQVQESERVEKDVADVLTFPGGTGVTPVTLPTDPTMIEHQRQVLADSIYQTFGLTRVEPDTLSGLGGVSGYALEILNRKSEGTFRRIRRQWTRDLHTLIGLVLDVTAYKATAPVGAVDDDGQFVEQPVDADRADLLALSAFWQVDPKSEYPERQVDIRMGSGYIVDDVMVRDDFTANLISRKAALRARGYDDKQILKIEQEIAEEQPAAEDRTFGGMNGARTGAGSTVAGSTGRNA